jgi:hypothetical protein
MQRTRRNLTIAAVVLLIAVAVFVFVKGRGGHAEQQPAAGAQSEVAAPADGGSQAAIPEVVQSTSTSLEKDVDVKDDAVRVATGDGPKTNDEERAISFFNQQRRGWLAVRNLSARYTVRYEVIRGDGSVLDKGQRSGTLEFVVTPLERPEFLGLAKVSARWTDDVLGISMSSQDVLNPRRTTEWRFEKPDAKPDANARPPGAYVGDLRRIMSFPGMFEPVIRMADRWEDLEGEITPRIKLFQRSSTPEEAQGIFKGEAQDLLMIVPEKSFRYWFSRDSGELRRFDRSEPQMDYYYQYENYQAAADGKAKFPARLMYGLKWSADFKEPGNAPSRVAGATEAIVLELTEMKFNEGVSEELSNLAGERR